MTTPEQLAKLPRWAQDHIKDITRERDVAVRALNEYCDDQTPSPFYVDEMVCTGEQRGPSIKRRYIQAHTIKVKWAGVDLVIDANDYGNRNNEIGLQWSTTPRGCGDVALIPKSFQSVTLKLPVNMRS